MSAGSGLEHQMGFRPGYLLDTCILIDHLRGYAPARKWLLDVTRQSPSPGLVCSVITLAELLSAVSCRSSRGEEAVLTLLSGMEIVPVMEAIARGAGMYVQEWRVSHGIGLPDALIAATARDLRIPLVTKDERHFPMNDIEIVVPY